MFDRRLITHYDWVLLLQVTLVAAIGMINLYSATSAWGGPGTPIYLKQLSWFGLGLAVATLLCLFDYRHLRDLGYPAYGVTLVMLLAVLVIGRTSMGATRWLSVGGIGLQPSEVMKIVIIVVLARYFTEKSTALGFTFKELLFPGGLLLAPVLLIMKQPDLGTAMLLLAIGGTMALFAGIRRATLVGLGILGVAAACGGWSLLHDYQRQRIYTFLNPENDPLKTGYHIIQSKIAVGSGGIFGQGFRKGTQAQLSFLPERHTDFAFSVFAEEWGFTGCLLVLVLYLLIVLWGIYIARRANDRFGMFLALGVSAMLFWHIVVNLGMVIGLLPVVGVPLPHISYEGTSK
ncbi:MAG: rod shape-determining protein RodA, partial [Desulfuromonas sp.]|nr:rod shape-determining protein RodA [Desulfuromonas sp.]